MYIYLGNNIKISYIRKTITFLINKFIFYKHFNPFQ